MNQQFVLLLLLFPTLTSSLSQAGSGLDLNPASSLERELEHLKTNSQLRHPDPTPTVFTEEEINAYLASGKLKLPAGVESVIFQASPGIVTATLRVDFDKLEDERISEIPRLLLRRASIQRWLDLTG